MTNIIGRVGKSFHARCFGLGGSLGSWNGGYSNQTRLIHENCFHAVVMAAVAATTPAVVVLVLVVLFVLTTIASA